MTTFVNDSFRLCHLRIDSGRCPIVLRFTLLSDKPVLSLRLYKYCQTGRQIGQYDILLCICMPKIITVWHNFTKLLYQWEGCNFLCLTVYFSRLCTLRRFAVDFFAGGIHTYTVVARSPLRLLGFLVISTVARMGRDVAYPASIWTKVSDWTSKVLQVTQVIWHCLPKHWFQFLPRDAL